MSMISSSLFEEKAKNQQSRKNGGSVDSVFVSLIFDSLALCAYLARFLLKSDFFNGYPICFTEIKAKTKGIEKKKSG